MKTIHIISFTDSGSQWNQKITYNLNRIKYSCVGFTMEKYAGNGGLQILPDNVSEWIGSLWGICDFVFIGAMGIAVRYIAPHIKDKFTDSAVIVMDETGKYVIPVLSGHVGGAVALSEQIAGITGGSCVITTATDIRMKFAVDIFAVKNQLQISNRVLAKQISAAVLAGDQIGFYSEYEMEGICPSDLIKVENIRELESYQFGIAVFKSEKRHKKAERESIMCLYARDIIIGIGCRKGVSKEKIEVQLEAVLKACGLGKDQICMIASIDVKKEEPGLLELVKEYGVKFSTYPAEVLKEVEQISSRSAFVEKTVGVDNVCERAALIAGGVDGELLLPKTTGDEVTFAVVRKKMRLLY